MAVQGYNFRIPHFICFTTRSPHTDTDFISASVAIKGRPTQRMTVSLGGIGEGTFNGGILFRGVPIADNEVAVFSYVMVNNGHSDPGAVVNAIESTVSGLAEKGAEIAATAIGTAIGAALGAALGTAIVPVIGTAIGALGGWLVSEIGSVLFANCDGPIAASVHTFDGAQLRDATSLGLVLGNSDHHPGVDSAVGCGSNSIYDVDWSIEQHAFQFSGAIRDKWNSLGAAAGFLGDPETDETPCPNGAGQYVHFEGGSIYWTQQTGAFSVHGLIRSKWAALGWEQCPFLGYPVTDETGCSDNVGRFNNFQDGSIYWSPQSQAVSIHGNIRDKWKALGGTACPFLGYPITDESGCPDGVGRYNHFEGGSIYWTPQTQAFSVHGDIRAKWASLGWEKSSLGYPLSDEMPMAGGGRLNQFQHGQIRWTPGNGAWVA